MAKRKKSSRWKPNQWRMELKNGAHAVVKRAGNRWLYIVEGWGSISKRSRAAFDEAVDARDACETHCRDKGLLEDE